MHQLNNNIRILITGISSIHGWPIFKKIKSLLATDSFLGIRPPKMTVPDDINVVPLCITNKESIEEIKNTFKPTHVIHAAGVCDLDLCEERPGWAYSLNVIGSKTIQEIFGNDTYVMYLSSDLIFSGNTVPKGGYKEEDTPDPISVAGKTFLSAEEEIKKCKKYCIIRLGLPLGDSVNGDKGAIDWIESRFKRNLPVTLFYDEWRSCISCNSIAEMVIKMLKGEAEGLYHYGGSKKLSLYEVGQQVLRKDSNYSPNLFRGIYRHEEIKGPPRVGNIALNSSKIKQILDANLTLDHFTI